MTTGVELIRRRAGWITGRTPANVWLVVGSDRAQQDSAGENTPQSWPHAQAINRNTPRLERRRAAA
jgi:hypothetical protein